MKSLSTNWFAEGLIDFEYKQYLLFAYLNEVKQLFSEKRLYPALSDVIYHYQNLKTFQEAKTSFNQSFPQKLSHFDFERLQAVYESNQEDSNEALDEIDEIIEYSIPQFQFKLSEGKELFDYFNSQMVIEPIGLMPIYKNEGYVFVHLGTTTEAHIYQYSISMFYDGPEKMRGVHTHYISSFNLGLATTYENIKLDLIRTNKDLPNPATYVVESTALAPIDETVLPIAKRRLLAMVFQGI